MHLAILFTTLLVAVAPGAHADSGKTTRYWDCCKPSCSWSGKAQVSEPVVTCNQQDQLVVDPNAASACGGGSAYMCSDQSPWAISDSLSYGFAAAKLAGKGERDWCCACYKLTFTSTSVAGKQMIVQVTNTGGDLNENHFDIAMPGGGVGQFNGCSAQWGNINLGNQYGGFTDRSQCAALPGPWQRGCYWRFDWFQNADNPSVEFHEVSCPQEMIDRTGCGRWS